MRPHRNEKIASTIQKELSKILAKDLEFNALVTILDTAVTEDLLKTVVTLGIIPHEKGPEVFMELQKHKREIQHKVLKRMKIKYIPTLYFKIEEEK